MQTSVSSCNAKGNMLKKNIFNFFPLFVTFIIIFNFIVCVISNDITSRIINGEDTTINKHPYMASLVMQKQVICGASVLNKNYILTAAHCVNDRPYPNNYTVVVGRSNYEKETGCVLKILEIIIHPFFNKFYFQDCDIAILKVDKDLDVLKQKYKIEPVKLPTINQKLTDGEKLSIAGWGTLQNRGNSTSPQLQEAEVELITIKNCQKYYAKVRLTNNQICATSDDQDTCQGDSGGPILFKGTYVQIGIVSFGEECGLYPAAVYTNLASYLVRFFIKAVTGC